MVNNMKSSKNRQNTVFYYIEIKNEYFNKIRFIIQANKFFYEFKSITIYRGYSSQ